MNLERTTHETDSPESMPSDQALLKKFQQGDQDAATELYTRYAVRIKRLADKQTGADLSSRVDSEQIVQSVFRTFFRRASTGQYEVASGDDLWKLFLVISLNKIRMTGRFHRATKRDIDKTVSLQPMDESATGHSSNEAVALSILKMTIDDILSGLPEDDKQIVLLRIDGHEVQEISQMTKRSKRTVERKLQEFRDRLSALIE
jgi:RNA polymerase sigma-70 factor, ECF subfamily